MDSVAGESDFEVGCDHDVKSPELEADGENDASMGRDDDCQGMAAPFFRSERGGQN